MERNPESIRIRDLTPAQAWGVCAALFAFGAGAAGLGFFVGRAFNAPAQMEPAEIVAAFYASQRTEFISPKDAGQYEHFETKPGGGTLVLLLKSEPIPESVRLRFGGHVAHQWEYEVLRSAVLLATNATDDSYMNMMEKSGVTVEYSPRPNAAVPELLSWNGKRLYLGSTQIYDGERTLWPSGGLGPFEHYTPGLLAKPDKPEQ